MQKIIRMETAAAASEICISFRKVERLAIFISRPILEDYRTLYRAYLEDPDLQDARARWPFVFIWDNHEFSWSGYQSQYVAGGKGYTTPAQQSKSILPTRPWWEFMPAMVKQPGNPKLEHFYRPRSGGYTPWGNSTKTDFRKSLIIWKAIHSLKIQRVLRWGRNVDLLLTDNWSFRSPDMCRRMILMYRNTHRVDAQIPFEIKNYGRFTITGDKPPETIQFNGKAIPNPTKNVHAQTYLGSEQRNWFLEQLGVSNCALENMGTRFWHHGSTERLSKLLCELGSKGLKM